MNKPLNISWMKAAFRRLVYFDLAEKLDKISLRIPNLGTADFPGGDGMGVKRKALRVGT